MLFSVRIPASEYIRSIRSFRGMPNSYWDFLCSYNGSPYVRLEFEPVEDTGDVSVTIVLQGTAWMRLDRALIRNVVKKCLHSVEEGVRLGSWRIKVAQVYAWDPHSQRTW